MSRVKRSKRLVNVIHNALCISAILIPSRLMLGCQRDYRSRISFAAGNRRHPVANKMRTLYIHIPNSHFGLETEKRHTVPKLQTQALLMKRKFMEEFFLISSSPVLSLS